VNAWLTAAAVVAVGGFAPSLAIALRGRPEDRLTGVAMAGTVGAVLFVLVAEGVGRPSYVDMALVAAVLGPAGVLVFARCLAGERPPESASGAGESR
jgi:multisubunit Na+/H+ antiporter MnhF subunit